MPSDDEVKQNNRSNSDIAEINFLYLLEKNNIEVPEVIAASYSKCNLISNDDKNYSHLILFISNDSNFYQDFNSDLLKVFSYVYNKFYMELHTIEDIENLEASNSTTKNSKYKKQYKELNSKSSVLEFVSDKIDDGQNIFIDTFKIKSIKIPVKLQDKTVEVHLKIESLMAEASVNSIIDIGGYNYLIISDENKKSLIAVKTLTRLKNKIKKEIVSGISPAINKIKYPDNKRFDSKEDFLIALSLLLDTAEPVKMKKPSIKSTAKNTAKKDIKKNAKKTSAKNSSGKK